MAMIRMIKGGTFFGDIVDYDWKGKFLVVNVDIADYIERRIIHWDNVESVYDEEYHKEAKKEDDTNEK